MDEFRLIKLIRRNGDRAAADELVRRYYDAIRGFARKQVGNEETALDLTQEIFVSMLRTIGHYDAKRGGSFKTWLYKIAANKVVDYFRSRACHELSKSLPVDDVEPIDAEDFAKRFEDGAC